MTTAIALAAVIVIMLMLWQLNANITAKQPRPGDDAPVFALPDQEGRMRSLAEFQGKWLVLYFYPRDDTPGCVEQAMRFRNSLRDLDGLGAAVCGVSVNDSRSHAAFARKYSLPFTLLADKAGKVAARYGSLRQLGLVRFARRNTFLVDPQGKIAKVYRGVNAARNTQDVIGDLKTIKKE